MSCVSSPPHAGSASSAIPTTVTAEGDDGRLTESLPLMADLLALLRCLAARAKGIPVSD